MIPIFDSKGRPSKNNLFPNPGPDRTSVASRGKLAEGIQKHRILQLEARNDSLDEECEALGELLVNMSKMLTEATNTSRRGETMEGSPSVAEASLRQLLNATQQERRSFLENISTLERKLADSQAELDAKDCKIVALESFISNEKDLLKEETDEKLSPKTTRTVASDVSSLSEAGPAFEEYRLKHNKPQVVTFPKFWHK